MEDKFRILRNAERFVVNREFDRAITEYQKIIQSQGEDPSILNTLGDLLLKSNRRGEALEHFQRVAEIYGQSGFVTKAIAILKKIHSINPSNREVLGRLSELYSRRGMHSESLRYLQRLARAMKEAEDPATLATMARVVELDPENPKSHAEYGEELATGDPDKAVTHLNRAAQLFLGIHDFDRALRSAERVLDLDDSNAAAREVIQTASEHLAEQAQALQGPAEEAFMEAAEPADNEPVTVEEELEAESANEVDVEDTQDFELDELFAEELGDVSTEVDASAKEAASLEAGEPVDTEELEEVESLDLQSDPESSSEQSAQVENLLESAEPPPFEAVEPLDTKGTAESERKQDIEVSLPAEESPEADQISVEAAEGDDLPQIEEAQLEASQVEEIFEMEAPPVEETSQAESVDYLHPEEGDWRIEPEKQSDQIDSQLQPADSLEQLRPTEMPTEAPAGESLVESGYPQLDPETLDIDLTDGIEADVKALKETELLLQGSEEPVFAEEALNWEEEIEGPSEPKVGNVTTSKSGGIEPQIWAKEDPLSDVLEEVDFYLKLELREDAVRVLNELIDKHSDDDRVLERARKVGIVPAETKEKEPSLEGDFEAEVDSALEELFLEDLKAGEDDSVNVMTKAPGGNHTDPKTQYDLGLAYREMGMLRDATEKFEQAYLLFSDASDPEQALLCSSMLASTYLKLDLYEKVVEWADVGLSLPDVRGFERKALEYDRALALEQLGEYEECLAGYHRIVAEDTSFRDVQDRIARIDTLAN